MSLSILTRMLENLPQPDTVSATSVAKRAAETLRPPGAFARF